MTTPHRNRPPSRPTTPLRRSSRDSLRESMSSHPNALHAPFPLDALQGQFAELSDSLTDLDMNFMHMQLMCESMSRFCESFGAFLYGMEVNAFCVDFPEAPVVESFKRAEKKEQQEEEKPSGGEAGGRWRSDYEAEMTFLTNDTSFVNEPRPTTPTAKRGGGRGIPRAGGATRGGRGGSGSGRGGGRGGTGVVRGRAAGSRA